MSLVLETWTQVKYIISNDEHDRIRWQDEKERRGILSLLLSMVPLFLFRNFESFCRSGCRYYSV